MPSVGKLDDVPRGLREMVEDGGSGTQIHTVQRDGAQTTLFVVGLPISTSARSMQLYLIFPLTSEQRTAEVVQSTLAVGGIVLLVLLALIANLVTRQVVRPVRQAAEVAERFADGTLHERMHVVGEDDVARLAESFNEMAESIQAQFKQLEEFGQLQRRFTSDVSHELRTPLTTVRMAADVLHASREQFPAGLARSTELLVDELDRFESLLGDLLEISRLDSRRRGTHRGPGRHPRAGAPGARLGARDLDERQFAGGAGPAGRRARRRARFPPRGTDPAQPARERH